jgi:hypothetical protein
MCYKVFTWHLMSGLATSAARQVTNAVLWMRSLPVDSYTGTLVCMVHTTRALPRSHTTLNAPLTNRTSSHLPSTETVFCRPRIGPRFKFMSRPPHAGDDLASTMSNSKRSSANQVRPMVNEAWHVAIQQELSAQSASFNVPSVQVSLHGGSSGLLLFDLRRRISVLHGGSYTSCFAARGT